MSIVSAFLVPGSPLPYVQRDNPPWGEIANAMETAGKALAASEPDLIAIYSTQWIAVLDQLWQTRAVLQGLHVDENWHEYGDLPFDMKIDVEFAELALQKTAEAGIKAKGVDYDHFPVDTGAIVASNFLNPGGDIPLAITSNNVYHDWQMTRSLGGVAATSASELGRKLAVIGVGGLSGSIYRHVINISEDKIANDAEDEWNRKILTMMEQGDTQALAQACPDYAAAARVDMGFKHFAFILGAVGGNFNGATVHAYGPLYGSAAAVVEFDLS
ncbi:MAG: tRNA U-34 5-methylaminomethyl-2-thiouridine biosynthesis protein [Gammaproteobacteria bacterium]|nr:tRNA U-34 5-methylaminomethyl-2-thiouridine biosynthesis protein [Gammaproteobacteria bacterium]